MPVETVVKSIFLKFLNINTISLNIVKIKTAKNIIDNNKKYTQDCLSKGPK